MNPLALSVREVALSVSMRTITIGVHTLYADRIALSVHALLVMITAILF
jgi:hypothetical protein